PTPWASFSFHPIEAVVEIAFLPIVVCLMPVHSAVIILFSIFSLLFNVMGHLGFELFPKGFTRHPLTWWLNTSTHHNLHHQRAGCNFGLYFNFWDKMMGTNHPDYHEIFDKIKA
ncbi:MAG TPA: sterol desaturase family protein, partial [Bacteroidetes bacterium]|nr:sterol desaturase family protein [Bacteroidota bacterium]